MPQIFYETLEFSFSGDPNTRICGTAKIKCYKDAEKRLFGEDIGDGPNESRECNCLEGCTLIRFDFEIDRAKFDWKATLRSLNYSMEQFSGFEKNIELFQEIFHFYKKNFNSYEKYFSVLRMQPSNVEIFFKDHYVRALKRSETHTISNFLAMCGGLFGLFLGCSALSIVEFIYTVTRRLYLQYRQRKSQNAVESLKGGNINDSFIENMGI